MKTRAQVRREIDIARACYAVGLQTVVLNFGTPGCAIANDTPKGIRKGLDRFLARYGTRIGEKIEPLPIEDLQSYLRAHAEFITDPHGRPQDLAPYIDECRGVTGSKSDEGVTLGDIAVQLMNMERRIAALEADPDEEPTVEQSEKRRPGRPRKNPLPE